MRWARITHFNFAKKILQVLCNYFGGMCGLIAPHHHGHFVRVEVELSTPPYRAPGLVSGGNEIALLQEEEDV